MVDKNKKLEIHELQAIILKSMKDVHRFCVTNNIQYYAIAGTVLGAVRHNGFIPWDDDIDIAMTRDNYEKFRKLFPKDANMCKNLFLQDYESDNDFGLALMRVCINGTFQDWPAERHLDNCKNAYIDIFPLDNVPISVKQQEKQAKQMKVLNQLCNLKLHKVGTSKSFANHVAKTCIHYILKIVPIKLLVRLKIRSMTKYNSMESDYLCSMQSHYSYKKQKIAKKIYGSPTLINFEDTQFYGPELYKEYLEQLYGNYMELPPIEKRPTPLNTYLVDNFLD